MAISLSDALAELSPRYFADYVRVVGLARDYAADTLRDAMRADPNDVRRRLHLINLIALEYAAYEDAAALLKSWLDWRGAKCPNPIESLMRYRPGEARLDLVLDEYGIVDGEGLFDALGAAEWLPTDWPTWFPDLNLEKTVRVGCRS